MSIGQTLQLALSSGCCPRTTTRASPSEKPPARSATASRHSSALSIKPRTVGSVPRHPKKPRQLVADGRTFLWTLRHSHCLLDSGWAADCRETLTLYPQPPGTGGPLRIVFAEGPGRYVPGGFPMGSGDVGHVRGSSLNLHEPGAVRALLDAASARGWQQGERRAVEVDGWPLLEAVAAAQAEGATPGGAREGRLLLPSEPGNDDGIAAHPSRSKLGKTGHPQRRGQSTS